MNDLTFFGSKGPKQKRTADNLFSTDVVEVLLGISEGPIKGLKDGGKTYYLGDTALVGAGGEVNFDQFQLREYNGAEAGEDIKSLLGGFGSNVQVGVQLLQGTPVIRSGTNFSLDYIDLRFQVQSLVRSDDRGEYTHEGDLKIEYKRTSSPNWLPVKNVIKVSETDLPFLRHASDKISHFGAAEPTKADVALWFVPQSRMEVFTRHVGNGKGFFTQPWRPSSRTATISATAPASPAEGDIWIKTPENQINVRYEGHWSDRTNSPMYNYGSARPSNPETSTWIRPYTSYTMRVRNAAGTAWVGAPSADYRLWATETQPFGPDERAEFPQKFLYWHNPDTNEIRYYNGGGWSKLGSSIRPTGSDRPTALEDGVLVVKGKTTSGVIQEYRIPVEPLESDTYDFRVTQVSGHDPEKNRHFVVSWVALQEITAKAFNWPGLAVTQVAGRSSDQLGSLPELSGIYEGRIVRVPSNYDPVARTYAGLWNGAWKFAYTNNPAYVGYDLVSNTRYGLNAYYPVELNKWDVYEAGRFCDVRTVDGTPRFTFNGLIDTEMGGREAINYVFGIFGGRFFDDGNGEGVLRLDAPSNPVALFSAEDVINGTFTYTFAGISAQPNDVTVQFINPELNWQSDRRRVFDQPHIDLYGRTPRKIDAVGCTSAAEAVRRGRYQLVTSLTEKMTVSFQTNRKGLFVQPYDIILLSDEHLDFGWSGRVASFDALSKNFTFRDPVFLEAGVSYQVTFQTATVEGLATFPVRISPTSIGRAVRTITVLDDLPAELQLDTTFHITAVNTNRAPKPFRILSVVPEGDDDDQLSITAIEVNRLKWDYIDGKVDEIPLDITGSALTAAPLPVSSFEIQSFLMQGRQVFTLVWTPSPTSTVSNYLLRSSRNGDAFTPIGDTPGLRYVLPNMLEGDYLFSITPVANGVEGATRYIRFEALPEDVDTLPLLKNLTARAVTGLSNDGVFQAWLEASWSPVQNVKNVTYEVAFRRAVDGAVDRVSTTKQNAWRSPQVEGNQEYVIEVRTLAGNTPIRASTYALVMVPGDDTIPDVPTGWVGVPGFRQITLRGHASSEPDFKEFVIYNARSAAGPFTQYATTTGTEFIRANFEPSDPFDYYRVSQRDRSGNESDQTPTIFVEPIRSLGGLDDEPPAIPANLAVTSTLGKMRATWDANTETDLAYYNIEVTQEGGYPVHFQTGIARHEWDVPRNVKYSLRVRAVDTNGNRSNWCEPVEHTTARDTVPPTVPVGVQLKPSFEGFVLSWKRGTEDDLSHYEIYESATTTAPTAGTAATYEAIANNLIINGLNEGVTRHYWLRAVDTSDNKSAWTARHTGTTLSVWSQPDDAGVPTNLALTTRLNGRESIVRATWTASANATLYEVGVTVAGQNELSELTGGTAFEFKVLPNTAVSIRVRALNKVSRPSAWTAPVAVTSAKETTPPATPTGLKAVGTYNAIVIDWDRNTEASFSHYEVLAGTANPPATVVARVSSPTYTLSGLNDNVNRNIRVRAVNTSDLTSPYTAVISATTKPVIDVELTTEKLAGLVDATSFNGSVEPIKVWTGAALPTTKQTSTIAWNGKLYSWNGTAYTAITKAEDLKFENITGALTEAQIAQDLRTMILNQGVSANADKLAAEAAALAASQSAGSAAGSASTASSKATEASNSATAAAASVVKATTGAARVLPAEITSDFWRHSQHGLPGSGGMANWVVSNPNGYVTVPASDPNNTHFLSQAALPWVAGRTYRITISARAAQAYNGVRPYVYGLKPDYTASGYAAASGILPLTGTGDWEVSSVEVTLPEQAATTQFRIGVNVVEGILPDIDLDLKFILIEDVSMEKSAAGHASAAATSASSAETSQTAAAQSASAASGSATTASTKAGEASTSAGQASQSATNAAGSASQAAQSATTAAGSATTAGQRADAAAQSATTASTKATEAGQSATAAAIARTAAETAKGLAEAAEGRAATSDTNAAGSASSALSYSTLAAGSLTSVQKALASTSAILSVLPAATLLNFSYLSGLPDADNTALPISDYGSDSDGAYVRRISTTPVGAFTRALVPSVLGNVYRVTARVKATHAMTLRLQAAWVLADGSTPTNGNYGATTFAAGEVKTLSMIFGRTAGGLVTQAAGSDAQWNAAIGLRFGVSIAAGVAGSEFRVYSVTIDDLTGADAAAREASAAAGSASAASTSASNAKTSETNAGQSASSATTAKDQAETARGLAVAAAGQAAQSETNAAGSATQASSFAQLASLALSGGMAKNPTFMNWTGSVPPNVSVNQGSQGTFAKAEGKYGSAIELNVTGTASVGPYVQIASNVNQLNGNVNPAQVLVTVEIQVLEGSLNGYCLDAAWRVGSNWHYAQKRLTSSLSLGSIQTFQVALDRPAAAANADAFMVRVFPSHTLQGAERSITKAKIHRFDAQEILTDSFIDEQRKVKATVDGIAESTYLMRVKAGGASAGFEMVAASDPKGSASAIRMNADEIILNGTVKTPHLNAGAITAEKLAIGFGGNFIQNSSFATGTRGWTLGKTGTGGNECFLNVRAAGNQWAGADYPTLEIFQGGTATGGYADLRYLGISAVSGATAYGWPVKPNDWVETSVQASTHRCTGELRLQWRRVDGSIITHTSGAGIPTDPSSPTNPDEWPLIWTKGRAPAEAAYVCLHLRKLPTQSGTNSYLFLHKPMLTSSAQHRTEPTPFASGSFTYIDGEQIITDSIKARSIDANNLAVDGLAHLNVAYIKEANITGTLNANILRAGTALAGGIIVNGETMETIRDRAANPAARVNAGSVKIDPGKITISGAKTLLDWRGKKDVTTIDGGALENDSVTTGKLKVGELNNLIEGSNFRQSGTNGWTYHHHASLSGATVGLFHCKKTLTAVTSWGSPSEDVLQLSMTNLLLSGTYTWAGIRYQGENNRGFSVTPTQWYEISTAACLHRVTSLRVLVHWHRDDGSKIGEATVDVAPPPAGGSHNNVVDWKRCGGVIQAPAEAAYCIPEFRAETMVPTAQYLNASLFLSRPMVSKTKEGADLGSYIEGGVTVIDGGNITTDTITANALVKTDAVITNSAQIKELTVTEGHITGTLNANKIRAGTALAGSITVNNETLETVRGRADNPANRINNNASTQINPGRILVSGGTSLADWRGGGDLTEINGGVIAANTVKANVLEIGSRNITLTNLQFEHNRPSANSVFWTAGYLRYVNDVGNTVTATITSGSAAWTSGVLFLYWTKGDNNIALRTTTSLATAMGVNNVILATYEGGKKLDADYGRTIIDGSDIKTGTVYADALDTTTMNTKGLAVFGGSMQSNNWDPAAGTGWRITNWGDMVMPNATITGAKIKNLEIDTIHIKDRAITDHIIDEVASKNLQRDVTGQIAHEMVFTLSQAAAIIYGGYFEVRKTNKGTGDSTLTSWVTLNGTELSRSRDTIASSNIRSLDFMRTARLNAGTHRVQVRYTSTDGATGVVPNRVPALDNFFIQNINMFVFRSYK